MNTENKLQLDKIGKNVKIYKYLIALLAVSAILLQSGIFVDEESAWWISAIMYMIVPGALVVFASSLTIKMAKSGQSIKLILLLTISVSFAFVAEQIWIGYELIGEDPFPSWADVFYLAQYPFLIVFLFKIINIPIKSISTKNRLFIVLLATSFLIPTFWSTYQAEDLEILDLTLAIIYPILNVIVLVPLLIGILYSSNKRNYFLTFLLFGVFAILLADTFYVFLLEKDLYSVGHPIDILWIWGYIFFIFAVYPKNKFLECVKNQSKKTTLRKNVMVPLLSGVIFLVTFMSLVVASFLFGYPFEHSSEQDLTELIFYGTLVIFISIGGITIFALKVKKIKTQFIVGLTFIMLIFMFQSFYDNSIDLELTEVSEYHEKMGTAALTHLDKINIESEIIHRNIHGFELGHEHSKFQYFEHSNNLEQSLANYKELTFTKNSEGEYLANPMMRQQMLQYADELYMSFESYQIIASEFFEITHNIEPYHHESFFEKMDAEHDNFVEILQNARQMETKGIITQNSKLEEITEVGNFAQTLSFIAAIISSSFVIIIISNSLKKNLTILQETTSKISRGDFEARAKINEKDTEISQIANHINSMAYNLSENEKNLIKTQKLKTIGELSSRLAHDLRNPLSSIRLSTKIIEQKAAKAGNNEYQKNLNAINKSISRMSYQLESVLDYIRTKPLEPEEVSINSIIKKVVETIQVPENIKIDIEPSDVKINCDAQLIGVLFTNLITNSIQAIDDIAGKISTRIEDYGNEISIKVIDSGHGISKGNIKKVFEPLYTTKQVGTGLGLSSVTNIVKQHNGTITVQNNPTTFTVTLPKIITIQEVSN